MPLVSKLFQWLLITSWGRSKGLENSSLSDEVLQKKIKYCREYLAALNILDPGISHNRGRQSRDLNDSPHTNFRVSRRRLVSYKDNPYKEILYLEQLLFL